MEDSLKVFEPSFEHFQSSLLALKEGVEEEKKKLSEQWSILKQQQEALAQERRTIQAVFNDQEQIILNVGGYKFTTTISTLRNTPETSLFNAMFSGRHQLKKDPEGCYFIDRDGRHFHDVLNFLRDRSFNYPTDGMDCKYLLELRAEAEYYGLVELTEAIDRFPYGLVAVRRCAGISNEESWMYEDGQDEIVISVDKSCQLMGVGLNGTEGHFTAELEVLEVAEDDFNRDIDSLGQTSQTFTKQDGEVVKLMLDKPCVLQQGRYYMLSVLIRGNETLCCDECLEQVVAGGVRVTFHCWESPNGTSETRGQFPELYIRKAQM